METCGKEKEEGREKKKKKERKDIHGSMQAVGA
jgi:hypothetical protein